MMNAISEVIQHCRELTDDDLTRELKFLAMREKRNLAVLLAHLAEYDDRRLFRRDGYPSLFAYCMKTLGYDENSAYRRITAARVIRNYPDALPCVADGGLTLTSMLILSPILTPDNHLRMFKDCFGKTRRELETLVAGISPLPSSPDMARRLPAPPPAWSHPSSQAMRPSPQAQTPGTCSESLAPLPPRAPHEWQAAMPLSVDRIRIGFDAGILLMNLLDRARQVLRHKYPEGRYEDILRDALELLLERKDPQRKFALKESPPSLAPAAPDADASRAPEPAGLLADAPSGEPRFLGSLKAGRYIPAKVKSAVWQRDGGRCAWRYEDGTVCGSRDLLEFDHVVPFAKGGRSDLPRNLRLLCRAHNQAAAVSAFGADACRARSSRGAGGSA